MTRRLIASYLAVTAVVLVMLEVPFAVFYAQRELDRLTAAVERDAAVVASIYEDDLEAGRDPDREPARRYAVRTSARVVVVDARGVSVVDTEQAPSRDFSTRPEIATALSGARSAGTRRSETLRTELLYVAVPVASGGIVHGAIRITLDTSEVDANVHRFWWGLGAMALVVLAAISLVGWLIARSVTLPLRRLNEAARRFGMGDLSVRPSAPEGPSELRELERSMAVMAGQLSAMIDEQRAFVADASHQLRTPLTGLRLRLENLQAELDERQATQIDASIDEISRLSAVVGDLLQLARADRLDVRMPRDLAALASDRVQTWSALADARHVKLVFASDQESVLVEAVPGAIEQILDNVLDNAIDFAPANTAVTVAVRTGRTRHRLEVSDQGPGMSDDEKQRATRRFWRAATSRPGSGLGLAIATSLATASGGSLLLRDARGRGLEVVVEFPVAVGPDGTNLGRSVGPAWVGSGKKQAS